MTEILESKIKTNVGPVPLKWTPSQSIEAGGPVFLQMCTVQTFAVLSQLKLTG